MSIFKRQETGISAFVEKTSMTAPYSVIQNRAPIDNVGAKCVFGNERIHFNGLERVPDEMGEAGQPVWQTHNYDSRIRFVGEAWRTLFNADGVFVASRGTGGAFDYADEYIEINFYGTYVNLLASVVTSINLNVQIDNNAPAIVNVTSKNGSLTNRNYRPNTIYNVTKNLSLGWHTVKIYGVVGNSSGLNFSGVEFGSNSSDIAVLSGKVFSNGSSYDISEQTIPYKTGFENVLDANVGTKGGKVVIYVDPADGQIKKRLNKTDTTALYMGSTNHSNEMVNRRFNFREFGRNRGDDFLFLAGVQAHRYFVLDDNSTGLNGRNNYMADTTYGDTLQVDPNNSANFLNITFTGTGLDVVSGRVGTATTTYEVFVDGVSQGIVSPASYLGGKLKVAKICSGLPYGTHMVKIKTNSAVSGDWGMVDFIVYEPKRPSIPSGAVILAEYCIMADFSFNSVSGLNSISTGVIRKSVTRELTLSGAINLNPQDTDKPYNFSLNATGAYAADQYVEYTFTGTGFHKRGYSDTGQQEEVYINGLLFTAANFPSATTHVHSQYTYNSGTGRFTAVGASQNSGYAVELPYGNYTVRFARTSATGTLYMDNIDIITPVHSQHENFGGRSIKDLRRYEETNIDGIQTGSATVNQSNISLVKNNIFSQILMRGTGDCYFWLEEPMVNPHFASAISANAGAKIVSINRSGDTFMNTNQTYTCLNTSNRTDAGDQENGVICVNVFDKKQRKD